MTSGTAQEQERLWQTLRRLTDSLEQHLDESQERQQQTATQLALLRGELLEHRAQQAEAQLRQAEAVRSLALRTGAAGVVGAGSVSLLPLALSAGEHAWPALRAVLHAVGLA